jgi:hypothetical protein
MIRTCLDLSTAHMVGPSPNFGDARHTETEHGYVVWVTGEVGLRREGRRLIRKLPPVPGWLVEIMVYAIQKDCLLINFDRDADTMDLFDTWEW